MPEGTAAIDGLRRIAIWGHYHGRNLGDELVVATIVAAVRRRHPDAEIVGISMTPHDTEARHGIRAYPINPRIHTYVPRTASRPAQAEPPGSRWRRALGRVPGARGAYRALSVAKAVAREVPFGWRSYRFLRGVDLIVVAGSGQLLDEWRGPWLHPYTTFRWALLARLARVPFAYPSVGTGPINSRLAAFFFRRALRWASFVSLRDRSYSMGVLRSIGVAGPFPYCPDMGYGYPRLYDQPLPGSPPRHGGPPVVGLNVIPYGNPELWPRGEGKRYQAYLDKMVAFARWLLARGYTVRLFSSQTASDSVVAREFAEAVGEASPGVLEQAAPGIEDVDDVVRTIASCDAIVAARFHSVLIPLALGIPVVGLAYSPKTSELLADVGLPERSLDIDSFTVEELQAVFERARTEGLPATVAEHVETFRAEVEAQFDALLGPVRARPTPDEPERAARARRAAG